MCYEPGARPPAPPISGGSGAGRQLTLKSSDGTEFLAFSALSDRPTTAGILVLPDVRGLHGFYEELALRFTDAGINATAIDYFGRTAGVSARDDNFEFMNHVMQTRPETLHADITAAIDHLRSDEGGNSAAVFTIGFCFGGRISFNQAADPGLKLSGVIGFYGRVGQNQEGDQYSPVNLAPNYKVPVLGVFGGADRGIPKQDVEAFRIKLAESHVPNEIVSYEGAPHSFFDRAFDEFKDQCDDAWARILRFIKSNSQN